MSMSFDPPDTKQQLRRFSPAEGVIAELSAEYLPLRINGPKDTVGYAVVHRGRMDIRTRRVSIEKLRKELKADALTYGRTVDSEAKRLTALLEPIETHLLAEEKAVDEEKKRIREERRLKEEAIIKAKQDAEAAEAKRIADAEAARVKAEQDAENERLRIGQEKLEAAQKVLREAQAAEEAKQRKAQEKLDAERLAHDQKMKADRQAIEEETTRLAGIEAKRVQAKELEEARAEAAEQAKRETEARIAREKEEAEAKTKAEEAARLRTEALRPDKEKLNQVANLVASIATPTVTAEAEEAAEAVTLEVTNCVRRIRAIADTLK